MLMESDEQKKTDKCSTSGLLTANESISSVQQNTLAEQYPEHPSLTICRATSLQTLCCSTPSPVALLMLRKATGSLAMGKLQRASDAQITPYMGSYGTITYSCTLPLSLTICSMYWLLWLQQATRPSRVARIGVPSMAPLLTSCYTRTSTAHGSSRLPEDAAAYVALIKHATYMNECPVRAMPMRRRLLPGVGRKVQIISSCLVAHTTTATTT